MSRLGDIRVRRQLVALALLVIAAGPAPASSGLPPPRRWPPSPPSPAPSPAPPRPSPPRRPPRLLLPPASRLPPRPRPSPPAPPAPRAAISAGYWHSCALLQPGGLVKCWGLNGYGQLGLGTNISNQGTKPNEMGAALPAVDFGPGLSAVAIASGTYHNCALLQPGGQVKCWGRNYAGQLGIGEWNDKGLLPGQMGAALRAVDLGPGLSASAIATGDYHTCALLQPGGLVKCWGANSVGQLGLGDTGWRGWGRNQTGAALPAVDLGPGLSAVAITARWSHTCALLQPGGLVKCWGLNDAGQLGQGDTANRGDEPGEMGAALPAVDLGPGLSAVAVSAGEAYTCAVLQPGGLVKCWGDNGAGQLGLGDTAKRGGVPGQMGAALPAVDLGPGLSASAVAAGYSDTCAVLQPGGLVKCWGGNWFGKLGQCDAVRRGDDPGDMGAALLPVDLGPGLSADATSLGLLHTCALLQPNNTVKCWGASWQGALGQGDRANRGDVPGTMGAALLPVQLWPAAR